MGCNEIMQLNDAYYTPIVNDSIFFVSEDTGVFKPIKLISHLEIKKIK